MERFLGKLYTYEFKLEAARLVELGQRVAEAARSLGLFQQTCLDWIEAHKSGKPVAQRARRNAFLTKIRLLLLIRCNNYVPIPPVRPEGSYSPVSL
jgi:transposase-like protein